MPIYDRHQRQHIDTLVEEYLQRCVGRRTLLQRAMAIGLSANATLALLAACAPASPQPSSATSVDILNVWGGEEQASFEAVVAPFTQQTGIQVQVESTRDLSHVLTTRILGHNPPDMAILPNPGLMRQLANQGHLIPLESFLDMQAFHRDYAQSWIDLGSYRNHVYALFYKATNKGTIWYNPVAFSAQHYSTPSTWHDLLALSDQIVQHGQFPWAMGVFSDGGSSGWPAADWLAQIYLNQFGPEMYDLWVTHKIPWTDASVKQAFQTFGSIVHGNHYIRGASQAVLATNFQTATFLPFRNPPGAYMTYLGDFAEGFLTGQFPKAKAGTDFNFFPFPTINPQYAHALTGGADVVVALKNTAAVRQLMQYMATAPAQEIWVKRGGFTSPNRSVNVNAYPDAVAKASAQMLTQATIFRFGADDLMSPAIERAFWQAMLAYIQAPDQLEQILCDMETTTTQYAST